ncbi:MAG: RecB-like helicase [Campylobacterota bacterium]|nr:RecB-like helicase [Campylobacterota bacterium]
MSFKPFLAYSASAGSGKTFALSVRYIALLFMGESPNSILAATFTKKAAAEMHQRVVSALRNLGDNEAFLEALSQESGLSKEALFAKQPQVLARFLGSSGYIVTLDSFFASILRSSSLELGLEPDFVTKEQGNEALEKYFLDEVQAHGLLSDLVKLAINIEDKRFLKIFDLMQSFYTSDPLLPTITHDIDNLSQLEQRIDNVRHTLHQLVVDAGASKTAINNFVPMSTKALFAKGVFEKQSLLDHRNYKKYVEKNPKIDEIFLTLKALLSQWVTLKEAIVLENLFQIYDYYKNATISSVKRSGVLSFDDLSYFTYRLLYESMSREFLYFKIDSKFRHILLDEFQDTSTLQFLLLQPLIDEIFSGIGQSEFKSFFYVGDTKQSLYRFRGGVEELFEKVAEHYGVKIEQMDTNYRSSKHVVEQVNRWFEATMQGYVPQKSREGASEGYVEVIESEALIDEAVKQVKRVLELGIDINEIAFLVNTNKDGQSLQEACHHEGVETLLKTSSSLKNIPKIAALVAMCEYLFFGEKIDAQAMLLKVGKSLEDVDTAWFSAFMSPLQVVDRLVREFGYFDDDLNVLKLLEIASNFSDIPEFVEEFNTSSIAVASNTIHGAKIMTIHGSKGLEFKYVILLDKLTRKNADKSALLYRYDERLHIEKIFYRIKGRDHFDNAYAKLMEARKVSSAKDSMNVLYVALTRAVEGMIILRKSKDSIFDALGMEVMHVGRLRHARQMDVSFVPELDEKRVTLSDYGTQEVVTQDEDEEKDYKAILFGTALHYALEMLGDFDAQNLGVSMMALQNRYGQQLSKQSIDEIEKRIEALIINDAFQTLLRGAIVRKEQSLSYEGELKQIDLLLEYKEYNFVIDYKSSKKYAVKHQNQVEYYKKAITNITGKRTEGVVIYLLDDGIEIINIG